MFGSAGGGDSRGVLSQRWWHTAIVEPSGTTWGSCPFKGCDLSYSQNLCHWRVISRRKFRSHTVLPKIWTDEKAEVGRVREEKRRAEKRREEKREEKRREKRREEKRGEKRKEKRREKRREEKREEKRKEKKREKRREKRREEKRREEKRREEKRRRKKIREEKEPEERRCRCAKR